jgi:hypothetical protein
MTDWEKLSEGLPIKNQNEYKVKYNILLNILSDKFNGSITKNNYIKIVNTNYNLLIKKNKEKKE